MESSLVCYSSSFFFAKMEESKTKLPKELEQLSDKLTPFFSQLIDIDPPTKEIIDKAYYMIKLGVCHYTRAKDHPYYHTILCPIIKLGDVDLFKKFVEEFDFDLEDIGDDHGDAFNFAVEYSATAIVAWLLEKNHVSKDGIQAGFIRLCTQINLVSNSKAIEMAKILIKYGADVSQQLSNPSKSLVKQVYYAVGPRHPFYLYLEEEFEKVQKMIPNRTALDASKTIQELTDKNVALNTGMESLKAENSFLKSENERLKKSENERLKELEKEFNGFVVALQHLPVPKNLKVFGK